ncbi:hypothetical protein [Helicobacter canis]|uniref:hypothetical protein n=1 Tax=Helicobacter canis TaxID=29419 RepID=UPI001B333C26|nr:hypothetical protein [Helicobacter canis]
MHALAKPHFYHPNPTASSSKLESSFLSSLRADNGGAAIHKNKAQKVDSSPKILESIALESKKLSLRDFALAKSWQSIPHKSSPHTLESKHHKLHTSTYSLHTFLESTFDKTQMDCHAIATALTRNDSNNAPTLKTPAKDSRIFAHNAQSAFDTKASGGRIC